MSDIPQKYGAFFGPWLLGPTLALIAILVPLIEIPMLVWARLAFFKLHPDYAARTPPTISRAISDPLIGDPFAVLILIVTAFIAIAIVPIAIGYRNSVHAAHPPGSKARRRQLRLLALMLVTQAVASTGMVICTHYTFANGHDLHMVGSYVFFFGQALVTLTSGWLSAELAKSPALADNIQPAQGTSLRHFTLNATMHRHRARAAKWIVAIALVFFALFVAKGLPLPIDNHAVRTAFTIMEIVTISAMMLYICLFVSELYRIGGAASRTSRAEAVSTQSVNLARKS